jgi:hypothetical protein
LTAIKRLISHELPFFHSRLSGWLFHLFCYGIRAGIRAKRGPLLWSDVTQFERPPQEIILVVGVLIAV